MVTAARLGSFHPASALAIAAVVLVLFAMAYWVLKT